MSTEFNDMMHGSLTHPGWKCSAGGEAFISVTDSKEAFIPSTWLHQPLWCTQTHDVQQELHTDQRTHHVHRIPHDQKISPGPTLLFLMLRSAKRSAQYSKLNINPSPSWSFVSRRVCWFQCFLTQSRHSTRRWIAVLREVSSCHFFLNNSDDVVMMVLFTRRL